MGRRRSLMGAGGATPMLLTCTVVALHLWWAAALAPPAIGCYRRDGRAAAAHAPSSALSATAAISQSDSATINATLLSLAAPHGCRFCDAAFASRNALFRHVRAAHDEGNELRVRTRQSVLLLFGYCNISNDGAGEVLVESFRAALSAFDPEMEVISSTQTSIAKARSVALTQDPDCPAARDLLVVNVRCAPVAWSTVLPSLAQDMVAALPTQIVLHGLRPLLPPDRPIHAEQSCSQHIYHVLLPVAWLPDANAVAEYLERDGTHGHGSRGRATPAALSALKRALRGAESPCVAPTDPATLVDTAAAPTPGTPPPSARFGLLSTHVKRPWHNFADPRLRGAASPNTLGVWRCLDRARIVGWIDAATQRGGAMQAMSIDFFLVLEFRGDQFLQQQVRRIVGAVVAVTHGWLPTDFMEQALDRKVFTETPLAPTGYMYRAGSRHHVFEMYHKGKQIHEWSDVFKPTQQDPIGWIQQQLIQSVRDQPAESWLGELRDEVAPRIRAQLWKVKAESSVDSSILSSMSPAPSAYCQVLTLLQNLVAKNEWPDTSNARASIILGDQTSRQGQAGSFTVVSPNHIHSRADYPVPLGNKLCPDLTAAVFELERALSHVRQRPPSTHCAINCNAQFTPHVDSGRGMGQSTSMIVALGDFVGGELMLEGDAHDIRYRPLEFDGWNMRHWTNAFVGQRFSLVWFTPMEAGATLRT